MSLPLLRLLDAIAKRPAHQREMLLPLYATAILKQSPEGSQLPPKVEAKVEAFWRSLTRETPEASAAALDACLRDAGITTATLRELSLEAGMEEGPPILPAQFEARRDPQAGEVRSGPLAQFSLTSEPKVTPSKR